MKKQSVLGSFAVLALVCCFLTFGQSAVIALSFSQRVECQKAIEQVYWQHAIWPGFNSQPKPGLDAMISAAEIERKTREYLSKSNALDVYFHQPIRSEHLQAEIDRIAKSTKDPEMLRESWAALKNDPYLIAECFVRPILVDRMAMQLKGFNEWWASNRNNFDFRFETIPHSYRLTAIQSKTSFDPSRLAWLSSNNWVATSTTGAPAARAYVAGVWTGSVAVFWGGHDGVNYHNDGGRYDPSTDSWSATTTTNAPAARQSPSAIWTGTEMIIWGGANGGLTLASSYPQAGGKYNPSTDTWSATTTTGAPSGRIAHTAVWTGARMIVWGGENQNGWIRTGSRYNPSTDSWNPTTLTNAPSKRDNHTAVWTGTQMVVWGGGNSLRTGARYNPSTNSWTATALTGAPKGRYYQTAVWTGSAMIVWGGLHSGSGGTNCLRSGGRYDPSANSWTSTTTTGAPSARSSHVAVWSGSQMIVWGGGCATYPQTGGQYDPSANSWTATSTTGAPDARVLFAGVFSGIELIVWGGQDFVGNDFNTGGRYTP